MSSTGYFHDEPQGAAAPWCIHARCWNPGEHAFASDPDDLRCAKHHDAELKRRIAAVDAAKNMFIALVGGGTR